MIDDIRLAVDTAYWAVRNRQWQLIGPIIALILWIATLRTVRAAFRIIDLSWNFLFRRGADK